MLPARVGEPLAVHLRRVRELHERDRASGGGRVALPGALERKAPAWAGTWAWQWVFPAHRRYRDRVTGERRRHHLDPTVVQRAMADAVRASGIAKRATCHTLLGHTEPRGPRCPQPGGRARRPVTLRGEDCRVCHRGVPLVRWCYAGWASGSAHTFTS
jgi:hypothetical protein